MTLKKYKEKRDFKKSPEPKGKIKKTLGGNLFVIQKHAASHLHYDFRLELENVLKSWAVPKGPSLDPSVKRLAVHVEDHPIEYGSFEGIIPQGQYGGGTVMLWDTGQWISEDKNPKAAYHQGNMTFQLKGKKLKGLWKLIQIKNTPKNWLLIKIDDKYARPNTHYDVTATQDKSVISGKSIAELAEHYDYTWDASDNKNSKNRSKVSHIKKKPLIKTQHFLDLKINLSKSSIPNEIFPQLATLVKKPPTGEDWLHEIKFDGYRLIAIKKRGKTKLITRNNLDWTEKFKTIAQAINDIPVNNIILDGEIVVLDDKQQSNFQLLQNAIKTHSQHFCYYIFDLIYFEYYNLSPLPLIERKNFLKNILASFDDNFLRYSDHIAGAGNKVLKKACAMGLEGIISKNKNSPYIQARTNNFLKSRCVKRQEFVIGGYTKPQHSRQYLGSLLLGTYTKDHELIYHGNVGTGFTEASLENVYHRLQKHTIRKNPFKTTPPASAKVQWVKPVLVAEVEFTEWTKDGYLRHPSFKGLREDKSPQEITIEKEKKVKKSPISKISTENKSAKNQQSIIKLTNQNKVLYPDMKITKLHIAEYYEFVAAWMLPYIIKRPLTLVRCPDTFHHCFFQKHFNEGFPSHLYPIVIPNTKDKNASEEYIYLKEVRGLLNLVQLNTLEIHPWGSRINKLDYPDIIIFDLDPAPEVAWKKIVEAAFMIKDYLHTLNLQSFVKTTGGKGLHIVVPIKPTHSWDTIKEFTHSFVNFIVAQNPQKYIGKMTKSARRGKIFVDYLRNQRGATAIAPYSTRARENAPVAAPLAWDELTHNIKDTSFNIKTMVKRLKNLDRDPWKNFLLLKQSLKLSK